MIAMAKITGVPEAVMSRVSNGRTNAMERRMMGLMLEQMPCTWDFREDMPVAEFLDRLGGQSLIANKYRKSLDVVYNDGLEDDCVSFIFQKDIYSDFYFCDTPAEIVYLPPNDISAVENALDVEINIEDTGRYSLYLDYDAGRYTEGEMKDFAEILDEILRRMQNPITRISEILR